MTSSTSKSLAKKYCLVIPGRGYSPKARIAKVYKQKIKEIAKRRIPKPLDGRVRLKIEYLYSQSRHLLDSDNLSKTICDALKGVAYGDDSQVKHKEVIIINRNDRNEDFSITGVPLTLQIADLLADKKSFTIIRLRTISKRKSGQNTPI